jgi:hypothetical protein
MIATHIKILASDAAKVVVVSWVVVWNVRAYLLQATQ